MIVVAEKQGLLKPGATIVEATSGNTGTGLAMAAAIRGYRCILVMPDKMAQGEDRLAARVRRRSRRHTDQRAHRFARNRTTASRSGSSRKFPAPFMPNQWHNHANPERALPHDRPRDLGTDGGTITHFVCGMGTGGTISGTARYLKEMNPTIHVVGRRSRRLDLLRRHAEVVQGRGDRHELSARDRRHARDRRDRARLRPRVVLDGAPDDARRGAARRRLVGHGRRGGGQARQDACRRSGRGRRSCRIRGAATCRRSSTTSG